MSKDICTLKKDKVVLLIKSFILNGYSLSSVIETMFSGNEEGLEIALNNLSEERSYWS